MTRIAIKIQEVESVFFLGEDNHWHIDEPDGLPVGLDRWGGITLLLSGPKSRRLLDVQPTDLAPYGLDSPPVRIEVDLKDGRTLPVLLGFLTPDEVGIYGQVEGFPQVFTIVSGWAQALLGLITDPPYPEWYYNIDTTMVASIGLYTPDKAINLTKDKIGWYFEDDVQTPLDETQLPSLLASLEQPSQQSLVEYGYVDLVKYGLDVPSLTLFLRTQHLREGVNVINESLFHIGNPTEDGTGYYVQTELDDVLPDVFMVDADWVEGLQAIVANPPYARDVD